MTSKSERPSPASQRQKPKPARRDSCSGSGSGSSGGNGCSGGRSRGGASAGLKSPILGRNFEIPDLYGELPAIELDDTLPYVPIYCHFIVPDIQPIIRPKTPPVLTALRAELEELQPTKTSKSKPEQRSRNAHHNHRQSNKNH